MIEYVTPLILILASLFVYKCVVQPKATLSHLVTQFQSQGYRVFTLPYQCMHAPAF